MIKAEKLKTYDPKKFRPGFMSIKRNGIHATYDPDAGHIFYSRTPKKIDGLEHLILELNLSNVDFPLIGELTIPDEDFETASGKLRSQDSTPDAVFNIFNAVIPRVEFTDRYERICALERKNFSRSEHVFVEHMYYTDNIRSFDRFYNQAVKENHEGVCWIASSHIYQPGKRTWDWMKRIPMKSIEVGVIDILPGTKGKKYEHSLGALQCEMENGDRFRVGIFKGQTDEWRQRVYDQRATRGTMKGHWITVEFKDYSKYGIPTQPRYKSVRWDL